MLVPVKILDEDGVFKRVRWVLLDTSDNSIDITTLFTEYKAVNLLAIRDKSNYWNKMMKSKRVGVA